ncbi:hypothetical protein HPP92_011348 [Vanilla planifolia]|uniref:Large ribosomal subunit protein uL15/eL18 domain-containing protein n=1 Tax=Vanilla planifolia TaxID=51239 RepID=A0A835V1Q4_VANPL|nr:hypothetical protein HPP92_011348 [Vanilla planifolia]
MGTSPATVSLLKLNELTINKGSRKKKKRKGRGIGSGKGKTAGRGHKGQRARSGVKIGFEGGQTPLRLRLPKRGFKNRFSLTFKPVGLGKVAKLINAGKIDSSELITMKTLKEAGAVGKQIKDGVKLMGRGAELIKWPIHLEVSRVTTRAKAAVEAAGGSVWKVHYTKLGFRALLKPEWFEKKRRLLPRAARPHQSSGIRLIALAGFLLQPNRYRSLQKKELQQLLLWLLHLLLLPKLLLVK